MNSKRFLTRKALPRRNALVIAMALGMGVSGLAWGQATSGLIFGTGPAGDTVQVTSNTGASRTVTVSPNGTYNIANLPLGTYTVSLMQDGKVVATRSNVHIKIGAGVSVPFAKSLAAINVTANALPTIDVTQVHDTSIITAAQLKQLPLARNASAIALLNPGVVPNTGIFGGTGGNPLINVGGASGAENAYYVNGYNTANLYSNEGGYSLPYGAIAQQQTMSGGFSAKYGRSDGGVISQTGKSGTNEWHFGVQALWEPRVLQGTGKSVYWPSVPLPSGNFGNGGDPNTPSHFVHAPNYTPGQIQDYRGDNSAWTTEYTGYIGGPLIKDKLFIFLDAQVEKTSGTDITGVGLPTQAFYTNHNTEFYGKINWNINDRNILEGTFLQRNANSGVGSVYNYDYAKMQATTFRHPGDQFKVDSNFYILHYTSYISDNATLSILYGKGTVVNPEIPGTATDIPLIAGGANQNPAYWPAGTNPNIGIINGQDDSTFTSPDSRLQTHGLRVDFSYQLGNHKLMVGIDNMYYSSQNQGSAFTGTMPDIIKSALSPEGQPPTFGAPAVGGIWIYLPGNIVEWRGVNTLGGMSVTQKAYYFQDVWQVTSRWQVNLGVRNDHYTNYNNVGQAFVDQKNQWEPRLGAVWDVFGDSSFKLYANAGRYYLALPQAAANRAADPSTFLWQIFSYSGIDPNTGEPTGLTKRDDILPLGSPDGEFGGNKDPLTVVSQKLKPMYIDQFNIGFDKKLAFMGTNWVYGAKAQYKNLGETIDDVCAGGVTLARMQAMGVPNLSEYTGSINSCRLANPGSTNNLFVVKNAVTGQYVKVPIGDQYWKFPMKPKRRYASLNLYLEHPFDGKWFGRVDYTYTSAFGNTVGQLRPDIGQGDVSKTEDWDYPSLMEGAYGELLTSRRQMLRVRGAWQVTPEWLVSLTGLVASGTPRDCLGYTGADALGDPAGYNGGGAGSYHWCGGKIVRSGSSSPFAGHTPWTHQWNVGVTYTPAFADHKLAFNLDVLNALNEQVATQATARFAAAPHVVGNSFRLPLALEPPRTVRLSVSYNY